jgi:hypothetical protein
MDETNEPSSRRVTGKAMGEWGDTLPTASVDPPAAPDHRATATHPPIVGMEEMPPATDAKRP